MLNKEIDYLKSSPALDREIWNSSKYIDLIVSAKKPLESYLKEKFEEENRCRYKKLLTDLIHQLENAPVDSLDEEKSNQRDFIIKSILQVENRPNELVYNRCKEVVDHFLNDLKNGDGKNNVI